jgi:pyruvate dehydrogenase E2 component (dihydrolipoamide acetyltransferase)
MPALEMAQESGKLISWLKKEGERVAKGEPLLEVETDKAVMEIESPGDGLLAGIKVQPGVEVPVGHTIAWIVQPGETPPLSDAVVNSGRNITVPATPFKVATPLSPAAEPASPKPKISPKARRLAAERGIDVSRLRGSGPDGEILAADILSPAHPQSTSASDGVSPIARLMAEHTTKAWTTVPHFYLVRDADASGLNEARDQLSPEVEKTHALKLTHTDLLVALVARVLAKHSRMNASWAGDHVQTNREVNIAIAIAAGDGVVAPVVHRANATTPGEIALRRRELVDRARGAKLRPQDLAGGTFTISNLGMFGIDAFNAIVTPPQAGVLAVGRIADRVVPINNQPTIRPIITLTLSCDHRVTDGARAAEFLMDVVNAISTPATWLS